MVQTLKPGQYKEDYPITTFSENKTFSRFFCQRNKNIYEFKAVS